MRPLKTMSTENNINETTGLSIAPTSGAKTANPNAPAANCFPTSPRPVDVSLVAITTAVARRATAAAGNISAMDLINK